jgi:hypothetical protein
MNVTLDFRTNEMGEGRGAAHAPPPCSFAAGDSQRSDRLLREKRAASVLDPHAFHRIPAPTPATYHCQKLTLSSSDGNDDPDGARHARASEKCLIDKGRLNLASIR